MDRFKQKLRRWSWCVRSVSWMTNKQNIFSNRQPSHGESSGTIHRQPQTQYQLDQHTNALDWVSVANKECPGNQTRLKILIETYCSWCGLFYFQNATHVIQHDISCAQTWRWCAIVQFLGLSQPLETMKGWLIRENARASSRVCKKNKINKSNYCFNPFLPSIRFYRRNCWDVEPECRVHVTTCLRKFLRLVAIFEK